MSGPDLSRGVDRFEDQKARDALAFDPLPPSRWVSTTQTAILIATPYSEPLSKTLRALPGAIWDAGARHWRLPLTAADHVRKALPEINRMASEAKGAAAEETRRRAEEATARKAALDLERAKSRAMPLRQEFLVPARGRPTYALTLEAIADNQPRHICREFQASVSQIYGSNGRRGWVRRYIYGAKDYSLSNSVGSRGVMITYFLDEGPIYAVVAPQSWSRLDRYFARVGAGLLIRMRESEVYACLEN